jgi:hypothetical protein
LQDPPQFTQIAILGLKIRNLATLLENRKKVLKIDSFYIKQENSFVENKASGSFSNTMNVCV